MSKHAKFIRSLPCLPCLMLGEFNDAETEWCHLKMADGRIAKPLGGNIKRVQDYWTLPMCGKHHRHQHNRNERQFWQVEVGVDPILVALALWARSGDYQAGLATLKAVCAAGRS